MDVKTFSSDLVNCMDSVLEEERTDRRDKNMCVHLSEMERTSEKEEDIEVVRCMERPTTNVA